MEIIFLVAGVIVVATLVEILERREVKSELIVVAQPVMYLTEVIPPTPTPKEAK